MKRNSIMGLILCACCRLLAWGQQPASNDAVVPPLVNFSGVLTEKNNKPMTSVVGVTFSLYTDQQRGAPLWLETQNVQPDKAGRYSVMLGSTLSQGLSSNLFASGAARWLGVQAQGQPEQPRVLLVAVPYALKALDAETIGGKPVSAFALATPAGTPVAINPGQPTPTRDTSGGASPSIRGSGNPGYIPEWLTTTKLGNSVLFQSGAGNFGISTITPAQKLEIDLGDMLVRGANNFGKSGDTAYLYVGDTNHPIEAIYAHGLAIGAYKVPQAIFIQDQTGNVGIRTAAPAVALDVGGKVNAGGFDLQGNAFAFGSYAKGNAFLGFAGNATNGKGKNTATGYEALHSNTDGAQNTAYGYQALYSNTTGCCNTVSGIQALYYNTTGSNNLAIGTSALRDNTTGNNNLAIGESALASNYTGNDNTALGFAAGVGTDGLYNATAIGFFAVVSESNALVLGGTGSNAVKVGIGTPTPSNIFTIGQGAGHAIADSWDTYSSRRWKTNIQTLHGALGKVEKLRGVSYDLKANGRHEVGVIAEEVGVVVPEVVTWDKEGNDAQSVDYGRLTALLIEAIKEQQRDIQKEQAGNSEQRRDLAKALRQIKQQQSLLRAQASAMQSLEMEVRETHETLRKLKTQAAASQLTVLAAK